MSFLSLRLLIPALLLFGMMLAAPNARAGSYVGAYKAQVEVTPSTNPYTFHDSTTPSQYSGATSYRYVGYTGTNPNDPTKRIFSDTPDASASDGSYQSSSSGDGYNGAKSDCSKPISTSWKWVPADGMTLTTDPPPTKVVIMQTCAAGVTLSRVGSTGSYDDGLGQSGSVTFNPPSNQDPPHNSGGVSGTSYFVMDGGPTVTLPVLNAFATVPSAPGSSAPARLR